MGADASGAPPKAVPEYELTLLLPAPTRQQTSYKAPPIEDGPSLVRETVAMSASLTRETAPTSILSARAGSGVSPTNDEPAFITLMAGPAQVIIDLSAGARIASWKVHGLELLEQRSPHNHPFGWGSFAMVPYAGRIRNGQLGFQGKTFTLPVTMGNHAIHGTAYDRPWTLLSATNTMAIVGLRFSEPWPFAGTVTHLFQLSNDRLIQQLSVSPTVDQPVTIGWHPWFRRQLDQGSPLELQVNMDQAQQWLRDANGIPTGKLGPVSQRPWDDCFHGTSNIALRWPGALTIDVTHDCPDVVLYDPKHAICVEPQSGPPNSPNITPADAFVPAGSALEHTVQWKWQMASR
jgi:aldose 1-epimerase